MTGLKKLQEFCTRLDHYPSRLAIQQEIERLLAEENANVEESTRVQTTPAGYWWCQNCVKEIPPSHVTHSENHGECGARVEWMEAPECPASRVKDPLAVAAANKGLRVQCFPLAGPQGRGLWTIALYQGTDTVFKVQRRPYEEAETEIRNALYGFPNKEASHEA